MNSEDIRGISVIAGAVVCAFNNEARMMRQPVRVRKADAPAALRRANDHRHVHAGQLAAHPAVIRRHGQRLS